MENKYTIEKGITLKSIPRDFAEPFPFMQMEIGDSFFVGTEKKIAQRCQSASFHIRKKTGKVFSTRKTGDGYRCWRTQ